jgi:hypothetical protein
VKEERTMIDIRESVVREALEAASIHESALHATYSGQFMRGQTCFGISGDTKDVIRFFIAFVSLNTQDAEALEEHIELADDLAEAMRTDDLGLGKIFYFPGFILS